MSGTFWDIGGNGSTGKVGDSTDNGVTWTVNTPSGADSQPTGWAYSPSLGLWVHGGTASTINWSSAPHSSWTGATSEPFTSSVRSIIWIDELSLFLAGAEDGRVASSTDGKNWTARLGPTGAFMRCFAWSPTIPLVVVGGVSSTVWTSPDGITWTSGINAGLGAFGIVNGAAWGNGIFVLVGVNFTTPAISSSTDGVTFTARTVPAGFTGQPWTAYYCPFLSKFFIATLTGKIATSTDGITWTNITSPFGSTGVAFASSDDMLVAVGGTPEIYTTPDGSTWTSRTHGFGTTGIGNVLWVRDVSRGLIMGSLTVN